MGVSAWAGTPQPRLARDHKFHPLRVREVVRETADTVSLVLEVPDDLREAFSYRAGQFVTFRLTIDGEQHLRSYSMSSAPEVDEELRVTVKRVPGGVVATWLVDEVRPGAVLETTCPAGRFCLDGGDGDLVGFAAGSGITPVISLVKAALATTGRHVRLLYANHDRDSIIFASALTDLQHRFPGRLDVVHHLDVERGVPDRSALAGWAGSPGTADYFLCGPAPFMTLVEECLLADGVDAERIHIERFTPPREQPGAAAAGPTTTLATTVTIRLDGRTETTQHRPGTTLLQTARQAGLKPPSSCEAGDCATCMAKIVEGSATMLANNALDEDEVADGWVLTCQAVPDPPAVHVVYGYDD